MTIEEQLARDEGLRLKPYLDTKGNLTVGYGHNLNVEITEEQALDYFHDDLWHRGILPLQRHLPYYPVLDEARRGVLINMCFNMGFQKLETFEKFLGHVARGEWSKAADEMLTSAWAKEVGERATRLATQMRTGEWQ